MSETLKKHRIILSEAEIQLALVQFAIEKYNIQREVIADPVEVSRGKKEATVILTEQKGSK